MNIKLTKTERLLLCGGLIGLASLMLQACDTMMKEDGDIREKICGNWESAEEYLAYTTEETEKVEVYRLAEKLGGDIEAAIRQLAERRRNKE